VKGTARSYSVAQDVPSRYKLRVKTCMTSASGGRSLREEGVVFSTGVPNRHRRHDQPTVIGLQMSSMRGAARRVACRRIGKIRGEFRSLA
jgi:hypothetical protein